MQNTLKLKAYTILEMLLTISMISIIIGITLSMMHLWTDRIKSVSAIELDTIFAKASDTYNVHSNESLEYALEFLKINLANEIYQNKKGYNLINLDSSSLSSIDESKAINIIYNSTDFLTKYPSLTYSNTTLLYINHADKSITLLYSADDGIFSIYKRYKV